MLTVRTFPDRDQLGKAAGSDVAAELRTRLGSQPTVRMVFAAAPSQQEMLDALVAEPDIDWSRVKAFQMDDYVGLPADAPERFGNWLRAALFDRLPFGDVRLIHPVAKSDRAAQSERAAKIYARLLAVGPIDLVCLGIGVNGHIAFNDPPVADFDDPLPVKVVELDEVCRQQQVDDGCFPTIDDVPTKAITLTVPRLLAADRMFCVVPGAAKAPAVRRTVHDEISTACPATALRTHPACVLYLDADSAREL